VGYLPATPSGLSLAHWSVQHLCNRVFDYDATAQLVGHTQIHATEPPDGEDSHSREHSGKMATKQLDPNEDRSRLPNIRMH
jgi:hypothetical protein